MQINDATASFIGTGVGSPSNSPFGFWVGLDRGGQLTRWNIRGPFTADVPSCRARTAQQETGDVGKKMFGKKMFGKKMGQLKRAQKGMFF